MLLVPVVRILASSIMHAFSSYKQDGKLYLPCAQVTGNHKATRVKICKTGLSALLPENVLNLNEGIS